MCVDACVCTNVEDREQVCGSASLNPPSHVFKGSNSGHHAFQASPLHTEPSHWPKVGLSCFCTSILQASWPMGFWPWALGRKMSASILDFFPGSRDQAQVISLVYQAFLPGKASLLSLRDIFLFVCFLILLVLSPGPLVKENVFLPRKSFLSGLQRQ